MTTGPKELTTSVKECRASAARARLPDLELGERKPCVHPHRCECHPFPGVHPTLSSSWPHNWGRSGCSMGHPPGAAPWPHS